MTHDQIRIAPHPLASLRDGRAIYSVIAPTEIVTGTGKDGPLVAEVREGSFVLTGPGGRLIVGPVDPDRALDLAEAVCAADPIALTGSQHIHILAVALIGLAACLPPPIEPAPAITIGVA
jgi:hypothetical protein